MAESSRERKAGKRARAEPEPLENEGEGECEAEDEHGAIDQPNLDSGLSFDDLSSLRRVLVAFRSKKEPSVDLWRADVVAVHPESETFDILVKELGLPLFNVACGRLFKPSASLPGV